MAVVSPSVALSSLASYGAAASFGSSSGLKAAATENRVLVNQETTGLTHQLVRWPFVIGSGDFESLTFSFTSLVAYLSAVAPLAQAITIEAMSVENEAGTVSTPVYFSGGGRSLVLSPGVHDVKSLPLLPTAFSVSTFSRASRWWLRARISIANSAYHIPYSDRYVPSWSGSYVGWYDPAATTVTNGVDGTGTYTFTGTAPTTKNFGYMPIILGTPANSLEAPVIGAVGDSVSVGAGDNASSSLNGYGMFQRSLVDSDRVTNPKASISFNRTAATMAYWLTPLARSLQSYYQYADHFYEFLGTNGAPVNTFAEQKAYKQQLWAFIKTIKAGAPILSVPTFTNTTSTDSYQTLANQTVQAAWVSTATGHQTREWIIAGADGLVDYTLGRSADITLVGSDYKWVVDGTSNYSTADGVHPSARVHIARANDIRTKMNTIPFNGG